MELSFWGKAYNGLSHPALLHMLDVGLVAEALIQASLSNSVIACVSAWFGLTQHAAVKWLPFFVAAHDLGKISPGFQRKVEALSVPLEEAGFPFTGNLESDHSLVTRVALGDLLAQADVWPALQTPDARGLAAAVAAHHGSFHRADRTQHYRHRKVSEGTQWDRARCEALRHLAAVFRVMSQPPAPSLREDCRAACLEWLAGFTTLCDWVGSDTDFKYCDDPEVDLGGYVADRREVARQAVKSSGLDSAGFLSDAPRSFATMFPAILEPREAQRHVLELASALEADFVVIEAATGSGKTEAALALAEHWGATTRLQGAYLALPSMATSNSLFGRVKDWIGGMHGGRIEFHLLHGHALLNHEYEALLTETRFAAISEGADTAGGEVSASAWFTGRKRGLLAPFAVGTVDQALLSVLDSRHQFLRLFGLACKVLILDEIHAYDTYTSALIERLLRWARAIGCRVVLLSATLPGSKLRSLVAAWSGTQTGFPVQLPQLPRTTLVSEEGVRVEPLPASGSTRPAVQIQLVLSERDIIAEELVNALQGSGCAACICNTVKSAQGFYTALKSRLGIEHVTLIHAQMPLGERLRREEFVLASFGRESQKRPDLHVVVGTQVLEQSLDVDFDLMFSELAPVDLILQRIGRLHRHERRDRPSHLRQAYLLLEEPASEKGRPEFRRSDKYVYSEAVLLRSWFALRTLVQIEGDHSGRLIAQVYDKEPEAISEQERKWIVAADEEERAKAVKEESEAKARMIDPPDSESFPDSPRAAAGILEDDDPDVHRALQALTRLGPPGITLVCLHQVRDGVFLDPAAKIPVDLSATPSLETRRSLVQASVNVTNYAVYSHFRHEPSPEAWRQDPVLRHVRVVKFCCGSFQGPDFTIVLDQEVGLLIETKSSKEE